MHKPPAWLTLGPQLGAGGMGQVYEATDTRSSERVAVKTLTRFSGKELLCLKNEFRTVATVAHANLVEQHELVEADGQWFLVMELVRGKNVFDFVRGGSTGSSVATPFLRGADTDEATRTALIPVQGLGGGDVPEPPPQPAPTPLAQCPDVPRLTHVMSQLAAALDAIHRAGLLHRDVKPANVLVTADGRVKLLDFGIAIAREAARRDAATPSGVVVGTPSYVAPEVLEGEAPSPASDWYGFGCVLFELIAGRRPFQGSPVETFRAKLLGRAPSLAALVPDVPKELAALTARLLARDPLGRPTYAELQQALGRPQDVRSSGPLPAVGTTVVGREAELDALLRCAADAQRAPRAAFVHGRSGVGKSALLALCFERLRADGALVLEGRCYEQEHVPYKSLDKLVDALAVELGKRPPWLRAVLPADRAALAKAFPVLRDALEVSTDGDAVVDDPTTLQRRALDALVGLLTALSREVRLVCCVDDLQWGDLPGAHALSRLLQAPDTRVLLLFAHRAEDAQAPVVLAARDAVTRAHGVAPLDVGLGPLSADASRQLAQVLAKEAQLTDPALVDWAQQQSQGEPFFLHELLFAAAREPDLLRARDLSLADVIRLRVERLSPDAKALLQAVCLAGCAVPQRLANRAAQVDGGAATKGYRELKATHFVRTARKDADEAVDAFHDKLREVVSRGLADAVARPLHARLGSAWLAEAATTPGRRLAAARHLQAAGDAVPAPERLAALLDGAREADGAFDAEQAKRLASAARDVAQEGKLPFPDDGRRLLAESALAANDLEEAHRTFQALAQEGESALTRAYAHQGLSRLSLSRLDTDLTLRECGRALRALSLPGVSHRPLAYLRTLAAFGWAYVKKNVLRWQAPERPSDALAARLYFSAGNAAYFLMKRPLVVQGILRGYAHVMRLGTKRETASWYAFASVPAAITGRVALSRRLIATAQQLAQALADPGAYAHTLGMSGLALDMGGAPLEGRALIDRVFAEYARWTELPDLLTIVAAQSWNHLMRGEPTKAWAATQLGLSRVAEAGSLLARGHTFRCYAGPTLALLGRADEGRRHLDDYAALLREYAANDRWRNMQLSAHRTLFLELSGADDQALEDAFARHDADGLTPKNHPHQLKQYFIAKGRRRLAQAEARPTDAAALAKARAALRDVRALGRHPTLALHADVFAARLAALEGTSPVAALDGLLTQAVALESPWPAAEAARAAQRWCAQAGRAEDAARYAAQLRALVDAHQLRALA